MTKNKLKSFIIGSMITSLIISPLGLINECQPMLICKAKKPNIKNADTIKQEFYEHWIKPMEEIKKKELAEKIRLEELHKQQEIERIEKEKKQKEESLSRGENIEEMTFILTFYTGLEEENSSAGAVNCKGRILQDYMVANNILPLGTRIDLGKYGSKIVSDRGGSNFNTISRLDVFIPREDGESDRQYSRRVNNMGRIRIKGFIIK